MNRQIAFLHVRIILAAALLPATVATAVTKNWNVVAGTALWNTGGNWSPAGVPGTVTTDAVNIIFTNGVPRTVTYDYNGPAITLTSINVNLTGAGTETNTISMSANNLTSNYELIGDSGRGTFNQSGGTNTISAGAGYIDVGVSVNAKGAYNLSGTGALLAKTDEYIGDAGTGVFNQSGGTNTITGPAHHLYMGYNTTGLGTYTLTAGNLSVAAGNEYVGYAATGNVSQSGGTFNHSGGTNITSILYIANNAGSTGAYSLSGSAALSTTASQYVGNLGKGVFNQTGGTNTITGVGSNLYLGIGFTNTSTATGDYTLSGGALSVSATLYIGYWGSGSFNQTGGTAAYGQIYIGPLFGPSNSYTLSGGSATAGQVIVGSTGPGGGGVFNVGGTGVLTVNGTLSIDDTVGTSVNLTGGTINAGALDFSGAPFLFNWTGGKLNLTQSVTWDSAAADTSTSAAFGSSRTLANTQTLMITGNETLGGGGAFALTLNAGSTHHVTGALTLTPTGTITQNAGSTLYAASFTQSGGTVNGTLQNQGNFIYQSGSFNGRLLNQGTVNLGPNFTAANGVQNDATIAVAGGQTLTANGAGFDNRGTLSLNDASSVLAATTLTNTGLIRGEGLITAPFNNNPGGEVRAEAGKWLKFQNSAGPNAGRMSLLGGTLEFAQPFTNGAAGQILGNGTVIVGGAGMTNQGQLIFSSGTGYIFGDLNNNTSNLIKGVTITGNSNVTFWDDVTHTAGSLFKVQTGSSVTFFGTLGGAGNITGGGDVYVEADLTPGASPASVTYNANVHFNSSAQLKIELGGSTPGAEYDQLRVNGSLVLGGTLRVDLIDLGGGVFAPLLGDSFNILDWSSMTGNFSAIQLPTLAGALAWNTSQLYTTGVLSVASAGLPGDYNNNGTVDAADYVVWRKMNDTAVTLPNDETPGTSPADYTLWRSHFGQPPGTGSGASTNAAVPEPAAFVLLTFAVAVCGLRRGRAVSKVPAAH